MRKTAGQRARRSSITRTLRIKHNESRNGHAAFFETTFSTGSLGVLETMDFLLIFLIPIILIVAVVLSVLPRNKGRRAKVLFLTTGLPFVLFFGDEIIGQAYLHANCSINGGYTYKENTKTDGYFDVDYDKGCGLACLEALTVWGFTYYETEVSYNHPYHASENGVYKYYLADKDSGLCAGGREIPREKGILPETKCVA